MPVGAVPLPTGLGEGTEVVDHRLHDLAQVASSRSQSDDQSRRSIIAARSSGTRRRCARRSPRRRGRRSRPAPAAVPTARSDPRRARARAEPEGGVGESFGSTSGVEETTRNRPPGASARTTSATIASRSPITWTAQTAMTASTPPVRNGSRVASPRVSRPGSRSWATASIAGARSMPTTEWPRSASGRATAAVPTPTSSTREWSARCPSIAAAKRRPRSSPPRESS